MTFKITAKAECESVVHCVGATGSQFSQSQYPSNISIPKAKDVAKLVYGTSDDFDDIQPYDHYDIV